jgi:DNA integrity scanning protein DisA with diadenylate cyclase activity
VIGDTKNVLQRSHQVVFNPFKGYPKRVRLIKNPEVAESVKELSKLDGAIIISEDGAGEAAGRYLDSASISSRRLGGLGARHRAAAGITIGTQAVSVVVSESTGMVTVFEKGRIVSTIVPMISRRAL